MNKWSKTSNRMIKITIPGWINIRELRIIILTHSNREEALFRAQVNKYKIWSHPQVTRWINLLLRSLRQLLTSIALTINQLWVKLFSSKVLILTWEISITGIPTKLQCSNSHLHLKGESLLVIIQNALHQRIYWIRHNSKSLRLFL